MNKNLLLYGSIATVGVASVLAVGLIGFKKIGSTTDQNTRQGQIQETPIVTSDELGNLTQGLTDISGDVLPVAECAEVCLNAKMACESISDNCVNLCDRWSQETRDEVKAGRNCNDFSKVANLINQAEFEQKKSKANEAGNNDDCQFACVNYTSKCLTLVPNANEALLNDGLMSCMGECNSWSEQKTNCILNAHNCESMSDICGL